MKEFGILKENMFAFWDVSTCISVAVFKYCFTEALQRKLLPYVENSTLVLNCPHCADIELIF